MGTLSTRSLALLGVGWLLWLTYSLLVLQNVLVGLAPGLVGLLSYYAWRLLVAFEALADGVQRLAETREQNDDD